MLKVHVSCVPLMEMRLADLKIGRYRLTPCVGVVVSPGPIFALLLAAESRVLAILVVAFGQPHTIRAVLTIVPVVIILIIVINAHVGRAARNGERCKRGGGEQHHAENTFRVDHGILLDLC
jgi:hypothetical protein